MYQFYSSLEGLEVITSADGQLIRGRNLAGAIRRIGWMKNSAEGGFASRKWVYERGGTIKCRMPYRSRRSPNLGQDILAMLIDEFGFTSRATIDGRRHRRCGNGNGLSPQKPKQEQVKGTSLFSSSPGEEMA